MHIASVARETELALSLINKGADVNAKDNYGMTPLHWASESGRKTFASLLIDKGADVKAKDNKGRTAEDLAKLAKKKERNDSLIKPFQLLLNIIFEKK